MRVIIESPFAGDMSKNVKYAKKALLHSLNLGESPLAFHLLYTQVLNDNEPAQRNKGITLSFEWHRKANLIAIYADLGVSPGMKLAMEFALKNKIKMEKRFILGVGSHRD
jgi:hypothetical protein